MKLRLKQPYPFYYTSATKVLKITALLAVIIPLFMILFKPFNISYEEHRFPYFMIAVIFGMADSVTFFFSVILVKRIFPQFTDEENWTIFRELMLWTFVLFAIGLMNFLLREFIYINPDNLSLSYLIEEILHSYLFGLLVATLLTLTNFVYLVVSRTHKASDWNEMVKRLNESIEKTHSEVVTIRAESEQDEISFDLRELVYVHVDGNYLEIYLRDEQGKVSTHIKRNTLKNMEEQLDPFPNIMRVHRSYLVNRDHIVSVDGNAQGYRLTVNFVDTKIPVSRSYIPVFDAVMNG